MLVFDNSYEEICISKAFVDIAIAGRKFGSKTIYIRHNLFHQSKLGRDVELQQTHIVLSKSRRDMRQVTSFSAELGLGSGLVDWYCTREDAKLVPYGHLLIELSTQTDDRLRYCTKTGSVPSKIYIRVWLKQSNIWTMNTQNLATLQVFQSFSCKCKNLLLDTLVQQSLSGLAANA